MTGDGNGWVTCPQGHEHWGKFGAAGLLLFSVADDASVQVLLQHRAAWTHQGDTWGLVGGARDSHEDALAAAHREAVEEAGLDVAAIRPRGSYVADHGNWTYTTVVADTAAPLPTRPNRESRELRWVRIEEVDQLDLHPGFAQAWRHLRSESITVLVDTANVLGSTPNGWWRDRVGATERLLESLAELRSHTLPSPDSTGSAGYATINRLSAVLEGAAASAQSPPWIEVERTSRGTYGDDQIVGAAQRLLAAADELIVVTADRELRRRLSEMATRTPGRLTLQGPRWLTGLAEQSIDGRPRDEPGSIAGQDRRLSPPPALS